MGNSAPLPVRITIDDLFLLAFKQKFFLSPPFWKTAAFIAVLHCRKKTLGKCNYGGQVSIKISQQVLTGETETTLLKKEKRESLSQILPSSLNFKHENYPHITSERGRESSPLPPSYFRSVSSDKGGKNHPSPKIQFANSSSAQLSLMAKRTLFCCCCCCCCCCCAKASLICWRNRPPHLLLVLNGTNLPSSKSGRVLSSPTVFS